MWADFPLQPARFHSQEPPECVGHATAAVLILLSALTQFFSSSQQDHTRISENAPLSWQPFLETLSLNFHAHAHIKCVEQKLGFSCNGTAIDTKTVLLPRRVCFKTPRPGPHPHNEPLSAAWSRTSRPVQSSLAAPRHRSGLLLGRHAATLKHYGASRERHNLIRTGEAT